MNQGVSEERLDDRLGELKNWIESELLHKLIDTNSDRVFLELVRGIVDTVSTNGFLPRVPNGLS